jgi:hypothetical protein
MERQNSNIGLFAMALSLALGVYSSAFEAAGQDFPTPEKSAVEGTRIAFNGDREGQSAPDEIYGMNGDSTGEFRLTPTTHSCNAISPRCWGT